MKNNRPVTKSLDDLLFRLEYWGNFYYEDGCKYAHEILLDYREELHKLVETALSHPKQQPTGDVAEALQDWEVLLAEVSRNGTALDGDALDRLNGTIRRALTQQTDVNKEVLEVLKNARDSIILREGDAKKNAFGWLTAVRMDLDLAITRAEQKGGV